MAVTNIPVIVAPFQGAEGPAVIATARNFGSIVNEVGIAPSTVGTATAATLEMSFVNDGYTVLFVTTDDTAVNLTITSVPDNAGRAVSVGPTPLVIDQVRAFGPFRPVWWNFGGVVTLTFSAAPTNILVSALSFVF